MDRLTVGPGNEPYNGEETLLVLPGSLLSEGPTREAGLGTHLGEYEVVREIGRGAMGTVYEARDCRDGRTVALKVLTEAPDLTPEQQQALVARLGREARTVGRLSHPNIVAIYEVGAQDGRHFLAMEYLPGETLRARLNHGPLSAREASRVLDQAAAALDAIHAAGVVHRDVKPSNVMLLPDGGVKLLDFGVARQGDDTTLTRTGAIIGSPAYMSPEQVRGQDSTPAADLWALGALLYEMLAGHPPFTGPTVAAVLYQVTHEKPPPVPGVSARIQGILRQALEKSPSRRFHSAGAMADALRAALSAPARPARPHWHWAAAALGLAGLGAVFTAHGPAHHPAPAARPALLSAPTTVPAAPKITAAAVAAPIHITETTRQPAAATHPVPKKTPARGSAHPKRRGAAPARHAKPHSGRQAPGARRRAVSRPHPRRALRLWFRRPTYSNEGRRQESTNRALQHFIAPGLF